MKITLNIDCTPAEARAFLGLPDIAPVQEAVMEAMREQMLRHVAAMDPEKMVETWLPAGLEGWERMQKMFWDAAKGASGGTEEER